MRSGKALGVFLGAVSLLGLLLAPGALAAPTPAPAWSIQSLEAPTNFKPGDESGLPSYQVHVVNSGGATTDHSPITIVDTLPEGLTVKSILLTPPRESFGIDKAPPCETVVAGTLSTVTCEVTDALWPEVEPAKLYPGNELNLSIAVAVPPSAAGALVNKVRVEGGGAQAAFTEAENEASAQDATAGFSEFHAEVTGPDGKPTGAADSHPYQYTTSFAVHTVATPPGSAAPVVPAEGDLKEIEVALPPGLAGNPTAVPRCSAQQFNTLGHGTTPLGGNFYPNDCPSGSAVGLALVQQREGGEGTYKAPIFNLVPPKGMPAQFGFEVVAGIPIYINTRVRSDGDYGITSYLHNVTEAQRVTAARVTIWGTPGDTSHDPVRGECAQGWGIPPCPAGVSPVKPFLRLPSSCANPLLSTMSFETWTRPTVVGQASDTEPAPTACEAPPFTPSIEAKPTTNVADAPSGLHFDLHLPQAENEDPEGLGEADLKDATVTLPQGLNVNPSSADGLAGCSLAQIGYQGIKEGKPSFSADPADCPDAAKVGSVEVNAPAVDHPLPGSVYLAKQGENPFNSLIAIYIAVFDPQTGVVVKLAGKVTPDPLSGQLTTTVSESPQLPFEDFTFDFFEGARAPLRTPAVCGVHTTTTAMTPWTAPASGPDATPSDSFETTTAPTGGACPTSAAALPNAPRFEAGTATPLAGAYAPFIVKLSRQDGSQELKGLDLTLPAGMAAKFAGVAECSDAAIASAEAKSGHQEQAAPSCPATSHLGTVTVGAGAGPAPYYVKGDAYLAGPYQGAPLSIAIITPALAGPFDLGTVVVRAPLYIDPETAQGTVKSSFPTILQGIPLDV
jgi:hypothetical protein